MILNIPHSSRVIPTDVRQQFVLSDAELASEIVRVTDSFSDELFSTRSATSIIFPVNRMVVDPERFLDDDQEPMSKVGMGVVYTRTSQGLEMRKRLSISEKNALINKYYVPHHDQLMQAVKSELNMDGKCLIVDCHSFPSVPLPCDLDKSPKRPDICIGTDEFHTPDWLSKAFETIFTLYGFRIKFNSPYSGTIVPLSYYKVEVKVSSIMIEVNRRLYMDESSGIKNQHFNELAGKIKTILNMMNQLYLRHR